MTDEKKIPQFNEQTDTPRHLSYLQRRVEHLLQLFTEDKLKFSANIPESTIHEFHQELRSIQRAPDGEIIVSSCGPLVRTLARTIYTASEVENISDNPKANPDIHQTDIVELQREYFGILEELILRAAGYPYYHWSSLDEFQLHLRTNAVYLANETEKALVDSSSRLLQFYAKNHKALYSECRRLGGVKLVHGGSSNFTESHFDILRKMLLYTDTVLIPDPVLPWIERDRPNERFPRVQILRNAFTLLQLKPLVDAKLPVPAICVFPSWEKSLETNDEVTQDGISRISIDFFSHFLGRCFEDESEIVDHIDHHETHFLDVVEANALFVAPEGMIGDSVQNGLKSYMEYVRQFRSAEMVRSLEQMPARYVVFNAIMERLAPQFHLQDNSESLLAHPLVGIPAQAHYFSLCAKVCRTRLVTQQLLRPETITTLEALNSSTFNWIGNISVDTLVELRMENANMEFRKRLADFTSSLHDAAVGDLDRVASEIGRGLAGMIAEHENNVRRLQEEYARRHTKTLIAAGGTVVSMFVPLLAPLPTILGGSAFAGKYLWDKVDEVTDHRKAQKSLVGVLALAKEK